MASEPPTDPGTRLLLDEAALAPGTTVLVVDEPDLARHLACDHRVHAFSDRADRHGLLDPATGATPDRATSAEVALLRLPTSLDQLDEYAGWAHASGVQRLAAVARERDLARRMNQVLERWFTEVHASRGRDKHRVLHAEGPRDRPAVPNDARWPRRVSRNGLTIVAHGGTFGTTRLDPGTRLLLEQLPAIEAAVRQRATGPEPLRVLDVGSGNGTLSSELLRALPGASLTAVDLSWAGAAATTATLAANGQTGEVVWGDALDLLRDRPPFDLIISNPPFHLGAAKDSTFTRRMLGLAPDRLTPGGQLWVVHNTHLPWLQVLRDRHPSAQRVAQDRQFSVIGLTASDPTGQRPADSARPDA